jgi:hypothetical protein
MLILFAFLNFYAHSALYGERCDLLLLKSLSQYLNEDRYTFFYSKMLGVAALAVLLRICLLTSTGFIRLQKARKGLVDVF